MGIDLSGKKILLGVTGSIAIYKSLELIRLFIKSGASVRVVISESAKRFIAPLTFETISQNIVLHEATESWSSDINHIGYAKWADIFVIAPASANTINKLSFGIADNLLLQTALAYKMPLLIAPSANTAMLENPATTESMERLKHFGHKIISPATKELACGDVGNGALAEPSEIFFKSSRELLRDSFWSGKKAVVTGGGTIERIDDVRFISNFSSGKMANALTLALYFLGAEVEILSSKNTDELPLGVKKRSFESTQELMELLKNSDYEYLFMVAAVSDFVPKTKTSGKIKKESLESLALELDKNIDILGTLRKTGNQKIIGFKAELDAGSAKESAKKMLKNKSLDAVCLNILGEKNGFGSELNEMTVFMGSAEHHIPLCSKLEAAFKILHFLQNYVHSLGLHGGYPATACACCDPSSAESFSSHSFARSPSEIAKTDG